MAGADTITSRILDDAREEARQALDAARARVEAVREETRRQIEDRAAIAKVDIAAQVDAQNERLHNMASLERRKRDLAERRDMLDTAFERALRRLQAMDDAQYLEFMRALLAANAQPGDTIIKAENDRRLTQDVLTKSGVSGLTLETTPAPLGGGCILRRGGCEMNATLPVLLAQARAQCEGEVAAILFGGKEG